MKEFTVTKFNHGYKLYVLEADDQYTPDKVYIPEVSKEYAFETSAKLKKAIATLLKEDD